MNKIDKIPCDICEYFAGDMQETYLDFASRHEFLNVCLSCQREAEDSECHMSSEVKKVLETLRNHLQELS